MPVKKNTNSAPVIQLSISFSGPMFFDFATNLSAGLVDIYVPYCPYHEAGFFFLRHSYSESDLYACAVQSNNGNAVDRVYSVVTGGIPTRTSLPDSITSSFPTGKSLKTTTPTEASASAAKNRAGQPSDTIYLLSIDGLGTRASQAKLPPTLCKRLFKLSVPMPAYLSTLYTDLLKVVPASSTGSGPLLEHSTALRFYYEWDAKTDITLNAPYGVSRRITPPVYAELPCISDIEIRYEGLGLEDDNDPHSDARSCFASLTALAGTDWWLYYNDGRTTPTSPILPPTPLPEAQLDPCDDYDRGGGHLKTGADCHAPIITMGLSI